MWIPSIAVLCGDIEYFLVALLPDGGIFSTGKFFVAHAILNHKHFML
jgi:hypothetical protein